MSEKVKPIVTAVCGIMDVGKSYLTWEFIKMYHKQHPSRGILIVDPNDEYEDQKAYGKIRTIFFDINEVKQANAHHNKTGERVSTETERVLQKGFTGIAKVRPFDKYGHKLENAQMKEVMICVCRNFRNGLILLDDVNVYMNNFQREDVQGIFRNVRHKSQDIIMHLQSLNSLTPVHWQSISMLRMHFDSFDVSKGKLKGNEEIIRIAKRIVDFEYRENDNERFYLFVNINKRKIIGVTEDQFRRAATSHLYSNMNTSEYRECLANAMKELGKTKQDPTVLQRAEDKWIDARIKYYLLP